MEQKFFRCEVCGNIIAYVKHSGVTVFCCGKPMTQIIPQAVDTGVEKHVPIVEIDANKVTVKVGEIEHPMSEDHYIEWISLQTKQGNQRKILKPGDKPYVEFFISSDDEVEVVYEYCNLHGLWKNS